MGTQVGKFRYLLIGGLDCLAQGLGESLAQNPGT